jgi:uncharacterized protein DUF1203
MSGNGATRGAAPRKIGIFAHPRRAMDFRIRGLDPAAFTPLFAMDDAELAARRAVRTVADSKPGFPCRVTLDDAEPDMPVLLLNYEHLPVDSPYRASHAIYVSAATQPFDAVNVVPPALRSRLLSVRAFDGSGMMVDADIADGKDLEALVARLFSSGEARYLHAHFARRGCFAARIDRA